MVINGTPVEHYPDWGLWVKHEEQCCPEGPQFSKTRGVFVHAQKRLEKLIGVLDTAHSRGGHAVARACALLNKQCYLFYPVRKAEQGSPLKPQQVAALDLGAQLIELPAGRSAVLYHAAKKQIERAGGYMFPNALKLSETVEETRKEFLRTDIPPVEAILVSASSGTIAAGVIAGAFEKGWRGRIIIHLGYSRPPAAFFRYLEKMSRVPLGFLNLDLVDEGYAYADRAKEGAVPPWPCDSFYDLKAFRWHLAVGRYQHDSCLLWNVG